MRSLLTAALLYTTAVSAAYAQSAQLPPPDSCRHHFEGYVRDISTRTPIPFATVQIENTNQGAVADERGYFSFTNLCQDEFDVIVSNVGYKPAVHHHDPYHETPNIFLASDSIMLQSVTVEGEVLPGQLFSGTVESLSPDDINAYHAQNLGDLASNLTGVSMASTGQNVVKPVIHGLTSNRVLVINNGVRHEFQSWGEEHAPEIDVSTVDNISVVKGAATVRYGPEALGGVLLINPPVMELRTDWQGRVSLTGKSNGRSAESSVQLQKGYRKLALLAQAAYTHQGDLRAPDYVLSNTGKRETSFSLGTRYHWSTLDFSAYYSHFDQELGILRGSITGNLDDLANALESAQPQPTFPFTYAIGNPRQEVQHDMVKLNGKWNGTNQSVEVQYAFQNNHRQEYDVRRGDNNERPAIDLTLATHTLDGTWEHPDVFDWRGSIGLQLLYQDNNNRPGTNTIPFVPNFNNARFGMYWIESRLMGDTRVEAGLRYDYQSSSIRGRSFDNSVYRDELSYQNVTATVGLVREIREGQVIRTNVGTAWRPPNIGELYSFGKRQASIEYGLWRYRTAENNEITTTDVLNHQEKAVPSEVGTKWIGTYELTRGPLQGELTVYANYIRNFIYARPAGIIQTIRGAFPFFIYDQDDALFAGTDVSIRLAHTTRIESTFQGSFLWAKDVENNENFVGLPPIQLRYQYAQQLPKFAFFDESDWSLSVDYTFRQFQAPRTVTVRRILEADESNTPLFAQDNSSFDVLPAPPGYLLAQAAGSGRINRFQLGFRVRNIFNKTYRSYTDRLRYFADEVGRNFIVSVNYSFK